MIKNKIAFFIALLIILLISFMLYKHYTKPLAVLIQAGHEGRVFGNTGSSYGKIREVDWNIKVANEVAKTLNSWGIETKRVGAKLKPIESKIAVAIHFDGSKKSCSSGASVGYKDSASKSLAKKWEKSYRKYFPFNWQKDNFTPDLKDYYGYKIVKAKKFIVIELGEISCKKQVKWLEPRLKIIAHLIAATIASEFGIEARVKLK